MAMTYGKAGEPPYSVSFVGALQNPTREFAGLIGSEVDRIAMRGDGSDLN
jgi:hypothetical protein